MNKPDALFRLTPIALALALGLMSNTAAAQDAPPTPNPAKPEPEGPASSGIEEIIVTAQKRAESLQDVPIAITALSSEALEAKGISGLSDLIRNPPAGLQIEAFAGSSTTLIVDTRGIINPDPQQGTAELGTAIYIDDVYLGRAQGLGSELADPERIEVLRGPQGTLFGRNAEGGAIRIVTKRPTGEFEGNAHVTVGDYGKREYVAHVNLPEVAKISVKVDALISQLDGYTDNPHAAGVDQQLDYGYQDNAGYRGSLLWRPTDNFEAYYAFDTTRNKVAADYFVLVAPKNPGPGYVPSPAFLGPQLDSSVNKYVKRAFTGLYNGPFTDDVDGHTLQLDYQISDTQKLRSISSYRTLDSKVMQNNGAAFTLVPFERFAPGGIPAGAFAPMEGTSGIAVDPSTPIYAAHGPMPFVTIGQSQRSQEFQLVGSTDQLEYVFGLYYFTEKVDDLRQVFFTMMYTDPAGEDGKYANPTATNPFLLPFPGQGPTTTSAESTSYAGFAQATWTPNVVDNRLHLTGGLRYTSDKKTFHRGLQGGAPVDLNPDPFEEKRWDPAATLAFDINKDVNTYLRYSQAYRAGGVSVRSPTFKPYGAEANKAWELGLKSEWLDRSVRANFALFQNRVSDQQLTVQVNPNADTTQTDTINAPGTTRVQGLEAELTFLPMSGLTLSLSYAYQDAEMPDALSELDPNASYAIPAFYRNSGTATVDYVLPPVSFGELAVHFDYSLASSATGTVRIPNNSYAWDMKRDIANARLTLRDIPAGPTSLKIAIFANNLFDETYPTFVSPGAPAILLPPRLVGVEFGVDF
jgi:iron complex outermembrane receptor protein